MTKITNIMGIGKRMPYKVPEGTLDEIERNVLKATACDRKPLRKLCTACITIAAAASLAIMAIFAWHRQSAPATTLEDVQQAFANLDNADQTFLSEIYYEDTFMTINY